MSYRIIMSAPSNSKSNQICPVCYSEPDKELILIPVCGNRLCCLCLEQFLKFKIQTAQVLSIYCPVCLDEAQNVNHSLGQEFILEHLPKSYYSKYRKFVTRAVFLKNPLFKACLTPDCEAYLSESDKCCPSCFNSICESCSSSHHPGDPCGNSSDVLFDNWAVKNNIKICPNCGYKVEKQGGCPSIECICHNIFCWNCGKNPQTPYHNVTCLMGPDLWNLNLFAIFSMIFVPVLIYFLPAFIAIVGSGVLGEPNNDLWIVRHKKYFYVILIVFSPIIEVFTIFGFMLGMGYLFTERAKGAGLKVLMFFAGLIVGVGISFVGIVGLVVTSFLCTVAGVLCLVLRITGKRLGKVKTSWTYMSS